MQTVQVTDPSGTFGLNFDEFTSYTSIANLKNSEIFTDEINEPLETVQTTIEQPVNQLFTTNLYNNQILTTNLLANQFVGTSPEQCIYQIVYPQELNLTPVYMKRGRPKKRDTVEAASKEAIEPKSAVGPSLTIRTRSGRLVKLPKHIERDFKRIVTTGDEPAVEVRDFIRLDEKENKAQQFVELQAKKRTISAQFRCAGCQKAYLGKSRMIKHLQQHPEHGPVPSRSAENLDVWNCLVDASQRARAGQKGAKFCEELTNLLHNVQLLKGALFKPMGADEGRNGVQVDRVLGNAIGLAPGRYKFDGNELYKDVTILKLITNGDFFKTDVAEEVGTKRPRPDEQTSSLHKNKQADGDSEPLTVTNCKNGESTNVDRVLGKTGEILRSDLLNDSLLMQVGSSQPVNEEIVLVNNQPSNLLDSNISSDEVMNVDQFVNERFKNIVENIDLGHSLNLDLPPTLEYFPFSSS